MVNQSNGKFSNKLFRSKLEIDLIFKEIKQSKEKLIEFAELSLNNEQNKSDISNLYKFMDFNIYTKKTTHYMESFEKIIFLKNNFEIDAL